MPDKTICPVCGKTEFQEEVFYGKGKNRKNKQCQFLRNNKA